MNEVIKQIRKHNPDLKIGEIKGILYILLNSKDITNNELVTLTGLPKETLKKFKQSISQMLVDTSEDKVLLSDVGRKNLESLVLSPFNWSLLENKKFKDDDNYIKNLNEITKIKEKYSPLPKRQFDQFLSTPETSYLKAKIIIEKGLVEDISIAFIGDDDLNSLSLASMSSEYQSITVFDVDSEILRLIEKARDEKGYKNINTVLYDARKDLGPEFLGKYDVVVFDPPYTKSGVTIFLKRAVELLGNSEDFKGKYVFMYYGNSFKSPEKILKIQEIINRFGFSIEDRIDKFARYNGAESIGNASSLYILKANKFTHSSGFAINSIYTYEKTKEEKFPFVDHVVFKVYDVDRKLLLSKGRMLSALEKICKNHKLKVIDKKVTDFSGGGMTITFILANSNFVVHTWPEFESIHLDLITCSPIFNKDFLLKTISGVFNTNKIESFYIE